MLAIIHEIIFFIFPTLTNFTWIFIPGGSYRVLKIGRSRNGYKKFKKTLTIWDRIFKIRYISFSKGAVKYQWYFIIMTYLGYLCICVIITLFFVSLSTNNFIEMLYYFLLIKCYSFELPAFIFTIINIGRPKNKVGLEWKFVEEYK